jgi:hypothetical protein
MAFRLFRSQIGRPGAHAGALIKLTTQFCAVTLDGCADTVIALAYYVFCVCLLQLPSFNDLRFVSLLGALMSAAYCCIAIVMSGTVHPGPDVNYNPAAVPRSPVERIMGVFNAMTTVFFAYGGHNVALEIQATIPSDAKTLNMHMSTVPAMMRGVNVTFLITGARHVGSSRG